MTTIMTAMSGLIVPESMLVRIMYIMLNQISPTAPYRYLSHSLLFWPSGQLWFLLILSEMRSGDS